MAEELPVNCRTPAIAEYDGTTDLQEHRSRFKNAAYCIDIPTASSVESLSLHLPEPRSNGLTSCLRP
ncbi:UNVERIFIED_CONTAM: hypothetical protein Sradi_3257400 [Sesamum radiatum]|uniref:Uncharacterized protein n=1 Tax=Sesamum radiatum TaxID=300843 RepID=A0AAW2R005_SESRA